MAKSKRTLRTGAPVVMTARGKNLTKCSSLASAADTLIYFLGPFPETWRRNCYILYVTDYFMKLAEAIPTKNMEACTTADVLVCHVFSHIGVPEKIINDQGSIRSISLGKCAACLRFSD
ncbi:hypothetical protein T06_12091 [Trichinella sp. T6]|nr:hypothetical protein T06_7283 [Trichinella sp. T6]KRX53625.1 hypothetical protein T06_12091 [Trichinella sp. T6]